MRQQNKLKVLPDKKPVSKPAPKAPRQAAAPAVHTLSDRVGHGGAYKVALAGAGGNGGRMVSRLAEISWVLGELGLGRLDLDLYDPGRVRLSNVGRQPFYSQEVGQYKACALIHRANCGFGLSWQAITEVYTGQHYISAQQHHRMQSPYDFLITCVDTGAARKQIFEAIAGDPLAPVYWLDLGNEADSGQVLLGQVAGLLGAAKTRLPCVVEKWPDHYDGRVPETDAPSCSLAEGLKKQRLLINSHMADWAAELLSSLLMDKQIDKVGYMVNLRDGRVNPLRVETAAA